MATLYDEQQASGSQDEARHRPGHPWLPAVTYNPGLVFGEDPALYDRHRPGYPRDLMEAMVDGIGPGRPVLEIGAGTGKATRALLALGHPVYAVEPDTRMADLLEANCGGASMEVIRAPLEAAELPYERFPLVVAAQSWHWVDPEVAYARVSDSLEVNGRLALLWHQPLAEQGVIGEALARLHAALAPGIRAFWPGTEAPDLDPARSHVGAATRFRDWTRQEHHWKRRLDSVGLVGWLCTNPAHRLLPVGQRFDLMSAVAAAVGELGGEVTIDMRTVAHTGHRV